MSFIRWFADWNERWGGLPRRLVMVLSTLGLGALALSLLPYVWPFAAAFLFAGLLEPFVRTVSKGFSMLPNSRAAAAVLGILLLFGLAGAAAAALAGRLLRELTGLARSVPQLFAWFDTQVYPALKAVSARFQAFWPGVNLLDSALQSLEQNALRWAGSLSAWLTSGAWSTASSIPSALLSLVFTVMSTYYLTADRARIASFFRRAFPPALLRRSRLIRVRLWRVLLLQLRSQLTISLAVMGFLMVALAVTGVPYGSLLGLLIGVMDALPVLGAGLVLLPWSLLGFVSGQTALGVTQLALYVCTVMIRQILEPRLVGRRLGLHPLATMVSMYVAYRLLGFAGLLAGPVLVSLSKAVLDADAAATAADPP